MSKIGFHIQFTDTNYRLRTPDFIAKKRVDGAEYKIAIELKSSSNVNEAIRNGVEKHCSYIASYLCLKATKVICHTPLLQPFLLVFLHHS